jgi:hypothetical protein
MVFWGLKMLHLATLRCDLTARFQKKMDAG